MKRNIFPKKRYLIKNLTIETLYHKYSGQCLLLNTDIQRGDVWDNIKKVNLIDSIFKNYPIPLIMFHEKERNKYDCIDGKQRLTAIFEYINNKFAVDIEGISVYFKDLHQDNKSNFKYIDLGVIILINKWDTFEIEDIFTKIQYSEKMTSGELLNSKTSLPIIKKVQSIYTENKQDITLVLHKKQLDRHNYIVIILKIIKMIMTNSSDNVTSKIINKWVMNSNYNNTNNVGCKVLQNFIRDANKYKLCFKYDTMFITLFWVFKCYYCKNKKLLKINDNYYTLKELYNLMIKLQQYKRWRKIRSTQNNFYTNRIEFMLSHIKKIDKYIIYNP